MPSSPPPPSSCPQLLEFSLKGYIKSAFYLCRRLLSQSTSVVYKGILSLLFSSMIIWDLPKLASGVKKLSHSKLGFAYDVLSPQVRACFRSHEHSQGDKKATQCGLGAHGSHEADGYLSPFL